MNKDQTETEISPSASSFPLPPASRSGGRDGLRGEHVHPTDRVSFPPSETDVILAQQQLIDQQSKEIDQLKVALLNQKKTAVSLFDELGETQELSVSMQREKHILEEEISVLRALLLVELPEALTRPVFQQSTVSLVPPHERSVDETQEERTSGLGPSYAVAEGPRESTISSLSPNNTLGPTCGNSRKGCGDEDVVHDVEGTTQAPIDNFLLEIMASTTPPRGTTTEGVMKSYHANCHGAFRRTRGHVGAVAVASPPSRVMSVEKNAKPPPPGHSCGTNPCSSLLRERQEPHLGNSKVDEKVKSLVSTKDRKPSLAPVVTSLESPLRAQQRDYASPGHLELKRRSAAKRSKSL